VGAERQIDSDQNTLHETPPFRSSVERAACKLPEQDRHGQPCSGVDGCRLQVRLRHEQASAVPVRRRHS
jgi:hypothetical protein